MGDREVQREKLRDEELNQIVTNLDDLGNPYDQMDIDTKLYKPECFTKALL